MPSPPTLQPWTILRQEERLSYPPWLTIRQQTIQLPSGRILEDFYEVALPDFAVTVARTVEGQYVLAREYKHALRQVTLTPPAGLLHAGEDPLLGAQRELREETGYESEHWEFLGRYVVDANRHCGTMHVFLAEQCRPGAVPEENDAEVIEVELYTRVQLLEALKAGAFGTVAGASAVALALAWSP